MLQVLFATLAVRCEARWLQGLPLGQYSAMIYKFIEQGALTAFFVIAVTTAPYGPPGYLWYATQGRVAFMIALHVARLACAVAMGSIMAKLFSRRVASSSNAALPPPSVPTSEALRLQAH